MRHPGLAQRPRQLGNGGPLDVDGRHHIEPERGVDGGCGALQIGIGEVVPNLGHDEVHLLPDQRLLARAVGGRRSLDMMEQAALQIADLPAVTSSFLAWRKRARLTWTCVMTAMASASERSSIRRPWASMSSFLAGYWAIFIRFQLALTPHPIQFEWNRKRLESVFAPITALMPGRSSSSAASSSRSFDARPVGELAHFRTVHQREAHELARRDVEKSNGRRRGRARQAKGGIRRQVHQRGKLAARDPQLTLDPLRLTADLEQVALVGERATGGVLRSAASARASAIALRVRPSSAPSLESRRSLAAVRQ